MTPDLVLTDAPEAGDEAAIVAALVASNAAAADLPRDRRPVVIPLRDEAGAITGGLRGLTQWGWLYIESFVVPPGLRGAGLGRRMLAMAEAEARARGCVGARLDTYSFQARGFYERHGYTVAGAIADCPPGHTRFTMSKRLDAAPPAAEPWPGAAAPRATVTRTTSDRDPAVDAVLAGLIAHNATFTGEHGYSPVNLVVRRPAEAAPCGGLIGFVLYGWFFVRLFYLPEDLRRGGLGSALLRRAEAEARAAGCVGMWLDTFSFQARPFYERLGFRLFGTLDDFPPGHSRHYLMKRLDGEGRGN